MITILGAGGAIGNELAKMLAAHGGGFRVVSRSGRAAEGASETVSADLTDLGQTVNAVAGSSVVYLLAGLKYDTKVWQEMWPRVMNNTIEACKRAGARLVFFDNVYMYGRVSGAMTEETPFNPCSRKGEVRAKIAEQLMAEWKAGGLTGLIARSADFYGPETKNSVVNMLVFEPLSQGKTASWLVNDGVAHSYTYTVDAARAVMELAEREGAWMQTWHLPTAAPAMTGKAWVEAAAKALGVAPKHRVLNRAMLKMAGWFNPVVAESYEMLYQSDAPYVFDCGKFAKEIGWAGTSYEEGIRATAESYRK